MNAAAAHSFVVLAYGKSEYLAASLESLRTQSVDVGPILVSTSTPYDGLEELCAAYDAEVVVHSPNRGIGHDWNMGLRAARTPWVTLAHQDDVYAPGYAEFVRRSIAAHPDDLIVFSHYDELTDGGRRKTVTMLRVKRALIELAFLGRSRVRSRRAKRRLLRFGNPVLCPSVAINRAAAPDFTFRTDMRTNMDWIAWLDLADRPGGFSVSRAPLTSHRIHPGSETSATIEGGQREAEDREVFERMWPRPVVDLLMRVYVRSYHSNNVA